MPQSAKAAVGKNPTQKNKAQKSEKKRPRDTEMRDKVLRQLAVAETGIDFAVATITKMAHKKCAGNPCHDHASVMAATLPTLQTHLKMYMDVVRKHL